jgi:hypothetical protein
MDSRSAVPGGFQSWPAPSGFLLTFNGGLTSAIKVRYFLEPAGGLIQDKGYRESVNGQHGDSLMPPNK